MNKIVTAAFAAVILTAVSAGAYVSPDGKIYRCPAGGACEQASAANGNNYDGAVSGQSSFVLANSNPLTHATGDDTVHGGSGAGSKVGALLLGAAGADLGWRHVIFRGVERHLLGAALGGLAGLLLGLLVLPMLFGLFRRKKD